MQLNDMHNKKDTIAHSYPNDTGIENDPDVLFVEKFEGDIAGILNRYTDVKNSAGMTIDSDVPEGSKGHSIKITNTGGVNDGGHLYKKFNQGFDSVLYLRYYVKYPSISKGYIHHESVWIGGYHEPLNYPHPRAGSCGLGDQRISIAYEPVGNQGMDTYLYWGDMQSYNNGKTCYGNDMINKSSTAQDVAWDKWMCVEMMIQLNHPATAFNGALRIWQDGKEVGYWGEGFPKGYWNKDSWFNSSAGSPFKGFRWRTDENLNINYLWIEFFDDKSPVGASHYIKYSNLVIAKKYIGPIKHE
ncbi:MAG: hypothetical protein QM802_07115 [Agriterribacter sp.]